MYRMPPAQSLFVDQRVVQAVETLQFVNYVRRIEGVLDLAQRGVIGLVEKVRVAEEPLSQLFFQRLLETKLLRAAQSKPIEAITNVAGEQFVSAFAREHDRHTALPRRRRKRQRARVVSLFHRRLAVIDHVAQTVGNLGPAEMNVVMLGTDVLGN